MRAIGTRSLLVAGLAFILPVGAAPPQAEAAALQAQTMKRYDLNANTRLDENEFSAIQADINKMQSVINTERVERQRTELLGKFDANHDGKLDDAEKTALKAGLKDAADKRVAGAIKTVESGDQKKNAKPRDEILKRFDASRDGKLDDAEKQAMKATAAGEAEKRATESLKLLDSQPDPKEAAQAAEAIKKFDANADGKLDKTEGAALRAQLAASQALARQEREARQGAEILKKHDANGDGKLDDAEKAAMKADMMKEMEKRYEDTVKRIQSLEARDTTGTGTTPKK